MKAKSIQKQLVKQKEQIIKPKLDLIMRSNCLFFVLPKVEIRLLKYPDITGAIILEFVIGYWNSNDKFVELI